MPPGAQCPVGFTLVNAPGDWTDHTCAPTAPAQTCAGLWEKLGTDGQCHAMCPNADAFAVSQCCPSGTAPDPANPGACATPAQGAGTQACAAGTQAWQGSQCCPVGAPPGPDGQCDSLCPPGSPDATDPINELACFLGFAPQPDPYNWNAGAATCWDGSKPVGGGDPSNGRCPTPPGARCQIGWQKVPAQGQGVNATWTNNTCAPTEQELACHAPSKSVGFDGRCYPWSQLCPGGGTLFPATQCCANGTTPDPAHPGSCRGPSSSASVCPAGTQLGLGSECCPNGAPPGADGQCDSLCPSGSPNASDPANEFACFLGFAPQQDPANWNAGAATCWDGSTPTSGGNPNQAAGQCPMPPGAQCPIGAYLVPAQGQPNPIWTNATCALSGPYQQCQANGLNLGVGGQWCFANLCPNGSPFAVNQCCPSGTAPDPANPGQCATQPQGGATLACPAGTQGEPGYLCCDPMTTFPGLDGQCHSLCPPGSPSASDPLNVEACALGLNPQQDPGYWHPNAATCWDGSKPANGSAPTPQPGQCPMPPGAECPLGYTQVSAQGQANPQWTDYTCQETNLEQQCIAQGELVGPTSSRSGQCFAICSGGGLPYLGVQCCPSGTQPDVFNAGQCVAAVPQLRRGPKPGETGALTTVPTPSPSPSAVVVAPSPSPSPSSAAGCAAGYAPTANGQCCLASQLTASGVCCGRGQALDAARATCVAVPAGTPGAGVATGIAVPSPSPSPSAVVAVPSPPPPSWSIVPGPKCRGGHCWPIVPHPHCWRFHCGPTEPITKPPKTFRPPWRFHPPFTYHPTGRPTLGRTPFHW